MPMTWRTVAPSDASSRHAAMTPPLLAFVECVLLEQLSRHFDGVDLVDHDIVAIVLPEKPGHDGRIEFAFNIDIPQGWFNFVPGYQLVQLPPVPRSSGSPPLPTNSRGSSSWFSSFTTWCWCCTEKFNGVCRKNELHIASPRNTIEEAL